MKTFLFLLSLATNSIALPLNCRSLLKHEVQSLTANDCSSMSLECLVSINKNLLAHLGSLCLNAIPNEVWQTGADKLLPCLPRLLLSDFNKFSLLTQDGLAEVNWDYVSDFTIMAQKELLWSMPVGVLEKIKYRMHLICDTSKEFWNEWSQKCKLIQDLSLFDDEFFALITQDCVLQLDDRALFNFSRDRFDAIKDSMEPSVQQILHLRMVEASLIKQRARRVKSCSEELSKTLEVRMPTARSRSNPDTNDPNPSLTPQHPATLKSSMSLNLSLVAKSRERCQTPRYPRTFTKDENLPMKREQFEKRDSVEDSICDFFKSMEELDKTSINKSTPL